ncbi:MAG: DUF1971 domain-containing protein [Gemmatimonadota bacterium]|nr:DUF1971 domain-containing protein [Gemmatimonadota bacterium]MDE2872898.1 DUF1971 domain-containing protein [Gemmatimonadota bacterium]
MTSTSPTTSSQAAFSPVFTQDTLPDALQAEHTLAPGHWAVLNLLENPHSVDARTLIDHNWPL